MVRGQGHKSWVSVVAFDPYNMSYGELPDGLDFSGSDEEGPPPAPNTNQVIKFPSNLGSDLISVPLWNLKDGGSKKVRFLVKN